MDCNEKDRIKYVINSYGSYYMLDKQGENMKKRLLIILTFTTLFLPINVYSDDIHISPVAPKDTPSYMSEEEIKLLMPYIKKAKSTYPEAKKRFMEGLLPRHTFFVTTRITEKQEISEVTEQVFIAVSNIQNGQVTGRIWSDIVRLKRYMKGDNYTFPEKDMIDWLITCPDGSEEGNYVGKFMDEYLKKKK